MSEDDSSTAVAKTEKKNKEITNGLTDNQFSTAVWINPFKIDNDPNQTANWPHLPVVQPSFSNS